MSLCHSTGQPSSAGSTIITAIQQNRALRRLIITSCGFDWSVICIEASAHAQSPREADY